MKKLSIQGELVPMLGRTTCRPRALSAALLFGVSLVSRGALGSGFSVARFASEHGHPLTDNPTAVYYNPAALTAADQGRAFADLTLALRRATYTRSAHPSDPPAPVDAAAANTGRATLSNVLVAPALGVSVPIGGLSVGFAWFTPFGAPLSWDERSRFDGHPRLPGPVDGVQRWHSIEGELYTTYLSLAAARSFFDGRLSVGVAFNLLGSSIEDVRARGDGTNDVEYEGRALLEASSIDFSAAVGVMYAVERERLWLGASYQSRPNLGGGLTLEGTARGNIGTSTRTDVAVEYDLPDVVRAAVRYRPESWLELRLFGDYTRYSAFERQCIRFTTGGCELEADGSQRPGSAVLQNLPRSFRDSVGVRVGASVFTGSGIEAFSGFGFDTAAAPDETLSSDLPDFFGLSWAVGARLNVATRLRIAASFTEFLFVPRTVKSELASYPVPSRQPDASGHYTQLVGAVNTNVEFSF